MNLFWMARCSRRKNWHRKPAAVIREQKKAGIAGLKFRKQKGVKTGGRDSGTGVSMPAMVSLSVVMTPWWMLL